MSKPEALPHRTSYLLAGPDAWLSEQAAVWARQNREYALCTLWVARASNPVSGPADWTDCVPGKHLVRILGRSYDRIVLDWREGWQTNHLSQAVGALRAGGQLFILLADTAVWPVRYSWRDNGPMYLFEHAVSAFTDNGATFIEPDQYGATDPADWPLPTPDRNALELQPDGPLQPLTVGQVQIVEALCQALRRAAETGKPLARVFTAGRGRGKTLALILLAQRLAAAGQPVLLTAALPDHLKELSHWLSHRAVGQQPAVQCIPWEQLTAQQLASHSVLVDEAAVLGVPRLRALLKACPRLVLATTTEGYEGSGQGFLLRFLPELYQRRADTEHLTLSEPIRWAEEDPVARQVAAALLADVPALTAPVPDHRLPDPPVKVDLFRRMADRSWVQLLAESHYQTRPEDIRQCVDDPLTHAWAVSSGDIMVGLLVAIAEPPLAPELAEAVWRGQRRPADQLAKQSIIGQLGYRPAGAWSGLRVWRLVVHPHWRRRGVASRLVAAAVAWAEQQHLGYVASAFGLTDPLLRFWRAQDFLPVRLGHQQDPASGSRALLTFRALTTLESERGREHQLWALSASRLLGELTLLHLDAARSLNDPGTLRVLARSCVPPSLSEHARARVQHWCRSQQPESGVRPLLALALWHWVHAPGETHGAASLTVANAQGSYDELTVMAWCRRVWLDEPWRDIQATLGLADSKATQHALRSVLAQTGAAEGDVVKDRVSGK